MTTRLTTRMLAGLALACTLLAAACADDFSPTGPILTSALSHNERGSVEQNWGSWHGGSWDGGSRDGESRQSFLRLPESGLAWWNKEASAVIGPGGGTVTLRSGSSPAYHSITVPAGTVKKPTRFVMKLGPGPTINVLLSATVVANGRRITRFKQPLSLTMSFHGSNAKDVRGLKVVYLEGTDVREVLKSRVNANEKTVTGEVWHFSRYAVACE